MVQVKALIKNITSLSLALLVLFSTSSFSVNKHYCGDTLVSVSLFAKGKTCGMTSHKKGPLKACSVEKSDCCKDVIKLFEGQDNLKLDATLSKIQYNFSASFVYFYTLQLNAIEKEIIPFKAYSPPLIVEDIQLLDAVFLI